MGWGSERWRAKREGVMRFVDEFREPELITRTADEIRRLADPGGITASWKCAAGTRTPSIASA